jgi:hypothetical protein
MSRHETMNDGILAGPARKSRLAKTDRAVLTHKQP